MICMGEMLEDEAVRGLVKELQSREQSKMRNALLELCDACDSANPCCAVRLATSLPRLPYNITAGLPYTSPPMQTTTSLPRKSQPSSHANYSLAPMHTTALLSAKPHLLLPHEYHRLYPTSRRRTVRR